MIRDPLPVLQKFVTAELPKANRPAIDKSLGAKLPWRPHVLEQKIRRGWYIHAAAPTTDSWAERIRKARALDKKLLVGVAAPESLLSNEGFLELSHELGAAVLSFHVGNTGSFLHDDIFSTVEDLIYERRLKLTAPCARIVLDRLYARALKEKDKNKKGVLLELLVAVLLSQVDGFEVTHRGISNRSQQMDVLVHNRIVGSSLGQSPIVLAEAKNWTDLVGPNEYAAFLRKLTTRHGRAKLGFLVTTGKFTRGVPLERRRESVSDTLVVLLDGKELPKIWRDGKGINDNLEKLALTSAVGD